MGAERRVVWTGLRENIYKFRKSTEAQASVREIARQAPVATGLLHLYQVVSQARGKDHMGFLEAQW